MKRKILLGLTTTKNSNWREKIKEIKKYKIKDVALFLTGIKKKEREELYMLLEDTGIRDIFHIHLRNDMTTKEIEYLNEKYKVKAFNIHPKKSGFSFNNIPKKLRAMTYIENSRIVPSISELEKYGGLCIDFSHWERFMRTHKKEYAQFNELLHNYRVGCCHISGINYLFKLFPRSKHFISSERELDYLKKYVKYLPNILSLELENSFKEQLKFKKYLENEILRKQAN